MLNIRFLAGTKVDLWNLTDCIVVNGEIYLLTETKTESTVDILIGL